MRKNLCGLAAALLAGTGLALLFLPAAGGESWPVEHMHFVDSAQEDCALIRVYTKEGGEFVELVGLGICKGSQGRFDHGGQSFWLTLEDFPEWDGPGGEQ